MSDQACPRLYVGNLPYIAQREDVMSLFAENGIGIKDLTMSIDAFTGRNPSYCFVDLHTEDDAGLALQTMQGQLVRGRPVRLNRNTERRQPSPKPQSAVVKKLNAMRYNVDALSHWTAPSMENRRLYVGGLPQIAHQRTLDTDMAALFKGYDIQAVSKLIWPHSSKEMEAGSHCYAFVDLATAEEAVDAARTLNGRLSRYGGRLRVSCAQRSKGSGKVFREQLHSNAHNFEERVFVAGFCLLHSRSAKTLHVT